MFVYESKTTYDHPVNFSYFYLGKMRPGIVYIEIGNCNSLMSNQSARQKDSDDKDIGISEGEP